MKNDRIVRLVMTALFAAMTGVATLAVHIPIPATQGYVNLGDGMVLLGAFFLGPAYGAVAAGVGSALADLLLGYAVYAPGTAVIKALCAVTAAVCMRLLYQKTKLAAVIAGLAGEVLMVLGYFLYESTVLRFGLAAAGSIPANAVQGGVGLVAGAVLYHALCKIPAVKKMQFVKKRDHR
ncbi:MAG: ECF transporter S component [Clostridia bacterium]|nr:ECF transporter S component [Clostridia bacterium]